ncbi:MAG: diguanylate cyclase [Acidobacteriota bacterium]
MSHDVGAARSTWNPELVEQLHRLVFAGAPGDPARLAPDLSALQERFGPATHSELLALLCNLRFAPDEAAGHWDGIVALAASMRARLGEPVSLPVAVVSYFVEVNRQIEHPVLVELKVLEKTRASVYRDELTGLYNYRYFQEFLQREVRRGERFHPPLSLAMVDIDDFKQFNDQHGHEAGNTALATIATVLDDCLRKVDVAARYGGEEFALVLPSTTKESAYRVCERARDAIDSRAFRVGEEETADLTVSIGVATFPADARAAGELVRRADSAMYAAKARGKNCVRLYGQDRRSYRRIPATLRGKFCVLAAEYHALTTVNLSEGGLRFRVDRQIPAGTLLDIVLVLPGSGREVSFSGRVVRVTMLGEQFEAAVKIVDISGGDHAVLSGAIDEISDERPASPDSRDALLS